MQRPTNLNDSRVLFAERKQMRSRDGHVLKSYYVDICYHLG